jgi:pyruvate/2-oxoglutarate dehydrogenase complex dihydrolipoamide dehydrogenase (E3) component
MNKKYDAIVIGAGQAGPALPLNSLQKTSRLPSSSAICLGEPV